MNSEKRESPFKIEKSELAAEECKQQHVFVGDEDSSCSEEELKTKADFFNDSCDDPDE